MIEIVNFAIEGNETKFVKDYVKYLSTNFGTPIFTTTGGWTKLHLPVIKNKFNETTNKAGKNLVLFDADTDYKKRYQELLDLKNEIDIEFELFLFPNNQSNGCVEDLLIQIINPKFSDYTICFDGYVDCVKKCKYPPTLNLKSKVFAYIECTGQEVNLKSVDFLNQEYWDLDHEALNPLKEFLIKNIA